MTRPRRTLLTLLALLLLAGGSAWYWQATAVDRKVNALLDKVRYPARRGFLERWLIKLGLMKGGATHLWYHEDEVAADLAELGISGDTIYVLCSTGVVGRLWCRDGKAGASGCAGRCSSRH
ncbi:MAG: hypothetical protein ACYS7M_14000, partial [Planctomycetota bacterium]